MILGFNNFLSRPRYICILRNTIAIEHLSLDRYFGVDEMWDPFDRASPYNRSTTSGSLSLSLGLQTVQRLKKTQKYKNTKVHFITQNWRREGRKKVYITTRQRKSPTIRHNKCVPTTYYTYIFSQYYYYYYYILSNGWVCALYICLRDARCLMVACVCVLCIHKQFTTFH